MEKIEIDDYSDYEEIWPKRRRKKKKRPPTKADLERRKQEILAARQARVEEAEKRIAKRLSFFPEAETDEGQKPAQNYIKWVKDSLELGCPRLNLEDKVKIDSFVASVRAGGQHRQKNRTAVRVTHLPTLIWAKNENERSFEQNKRQAVAALFEKLEEHLQLWQTLVRDSSTPIDIEKKIFSLVESQKGQNGV